MDQNPNMVDSLFVPADCILHITPIAGRIRAERQLFLSKGSYHKFRGYMHAQISKLDRKPEGKRKESFERWGFDLKYAAHAVRLADECEQILEFGDLNLRRTKEHLKAIRKGDVKLDDIRKWLTDKERHLGNLYQKSKLRNTPDKPKIKELLLTCLEQYFGNLEKAEFVNPNKYQTMIDQIKEIVK